MARQWYRHQIKSLCEFNANLWNFPWSLVYRAWNAVNTVVEQACSISCEWWGSERIMNIFIKQLNTYGIFTWIAANGVELQNGIFFKNGYLKRGLSLHSWWEKNRGFGRVLSEWFLSFCILQIPIYKLCHLKKKRSFARSHRTFWSTNK